MTDSLQAVERARRIVNEQMILPHQVKELAGDVLALAAALADTERERDEWEAELARLQTDLDSVFLEPLKAAEARVAELEAFVNSCASLNPDFGPMDIHGLVGDARALAAHPSGCAEEPKET